MDQYRVYTDNISTFRTGVRNGAFVVDIEITATGFAGTINVDWRNIVQY